LETLAGVNEYPTRIKCAILAWHTMRSALADGDAPVSTE
jgi:nitrogen fixation NifU-like protein